MSHPNKQYNSTDDASSQIEINKQQSKPKFFKFDLASDADGA
jgi:hypothetical protein